MKIFKSHFWYTKNQRNGIFLLVLLIVLLQGFIFTDVFSKDEIINTNSKDLLAFQYQIDSLKLVEIENRKPKIYPFNPNYITDYRGEQLGLSLKEIDRLLAFRKTNKFINSEEEFQKVTKVSDSLLNKISPYFKFPDWVVKRNKNHLKPNSSVISSEVEKSHTYNKSKHKLTTTDINKAIAEDFKTINGIGSAFSERIIKYRSKLQGFSFHDQIYEVWGLEKEVADRVLAVFRIDKKPTIKKLNVNTVEFKQLLKNPYIDYNLCKNIFNYRDEVAELQDISELKNIKDFPVELYDRIVLYLLAE
jgi:DNA uptake protein ComE-like DNA-binding protein